MSQLPGKLRAEHARERWDSDYYVEPAECVDRLFDTVRLGDAAGERGREGRTGGQSWTPTRLRDEAQRDHWQNADWLQCLDGKARRVESTIQPLAHAGEWGFGSRVDILRGAGNSIIPALAAEFIAAFMDIC